VQIACGRTGPAWRLVSFRHDIPATLRQLIYTALAALAIAPTAGAQTVLTAITAEDLAVSVRSAGEGFGVPIAARAQTAPDTSYVVIGEIMFPDDSTAASDTLRFFVGLDSCEGTACGALSAVAFFGTGGNGPGPDDMNVWNSSRRLTRAYVTPDGLALQSDYDLVGGVTDASLERFIRSFMISLVTFADVLQGAVATQNAPAAPAPE